MTQQPRRRVAVATADALGERMAGPAIRSWQMARALAREHDVELLSTVAADRAGDGFRVSAGGAPELRKLVEWCDVFVFQGWVLVGRSFIPDSDRVLVADVYDPMHLEQLEQGKEAGVDGRRLAIEGATAALNEQLLRGDFFLCASDKQRDLWLGHLASLGRINARTYDDDPSMRRLIDVVPFGVDDVAPERTGPGAKGVIQGIEDGDELVLWGGGVYNWFDPLSLVRAVDGLRATHPRVRLLFMGGRHPNPEIPEMQMAVEARRLSAELGLLDTHVFFNDDWVRYDDRQNFLLDADVAVSMHLDHVETAFSFRTRILDYLWAGLPIVTTAGDAMAALVAERGAGLTVPPEDPAAIESALDRLLSDPQLAAGCRAASGAAATELRWSRVLQPLLEFCRDPHRAPDLVDPRLGVVLAGARRKAGPPPARGVRHYIAVARQELREGGVVQLLRRTWSRLRRVVQR
ncbi:MAG TPA: glycosyltransferase [Acidimicrobiales bacterium]|nr:glycosyltransferase [Acidimicrobiales bacterium]